MSFLGQNCVEHGSIVATGECCAGLTAWGYDANSGQAYNGFGCWNAPCANAGQWAGPSGVGNKCCMGLTNVNGRCAYPDSGGQTPLPGSGGSDGNLIGGIPDMYLYVGLAALAALMFMGGKK